MSAEHAIKTSVRSAKAEDIEPLFRMARRFSDESDLPLTFDEAKARESIWRLIHDLSVIFLVEEDEGILTGAVLGYVESDFFVEHCGYILKLYVEKEFRGLGTSRALLAAFDAEAGSRGAKVIFASATAGMGDRVAHLYVRLFERSGYRVLGQVLVKEV